MLQSYSQLIAIVGVQGKNGMDLYKQIDTDISPLDSHSFDSRSAPVLSSPSAIWSPYYGISALGNSCHLLGLGLGLAVSSIHVGLVLL